MGGVGESNLMLKDREHCGGGQAREKILSVGLDCPHYSKIDPPSILQY